MLTSPITTPFFHSRVLALFSNHSTNLTNCSSTDPPNPTIPPLSPVDTPLPPTSAVNQIVGTVSPWIDLSSPDPLIYDISRQVLELEIAYAAFCGLSSVIVPGPKLRYGNAHGEGVAQYAHAIQDTLGIGNYTQILIKLSMMDHPDYEEDDMMGSLAPFARPEYIEQGGKQEVDLLGTWDAWHVIRTICKYNARLFVGKKSYVELLLLPLPYCRIFRSLPTVFKGGDRMAMGGKDLFGGTIPLLSSHVTTAQLLIP